MNRLFKSGIVTSIIGLMILAASFFMWMTQKATQIECATMAGFGLMFLRSKDSLIGISEKED
jgi:hypothetical protein